MSAYTDNGAGGGVYSLFSPQQITRDEINGTKLSQDVYDFRTLNTVWIQVVAEDTTTTIYYKLEVTLAN